MMNEKLREAIFEAGYKSVRQYIAASQLSNMTIYRALRGDNLNARTIYLLEKELNTKRHESDLKERGEG